MIRILSFVIFLKSVEKCENEKRKNEREVLSGPRAPRWVKYFQKSMQFKKRVQLLNINGIFRGYFLYKKVMKSVTVRFEHKTNSFFG